MTLHYRKFKNILDTYNFFEFKPKIVVGVSGGPDSIALVMLLKKWITEIRGEIIAIVINHNVRKNSLIEAKSVKKYLMRNKISSQIITLRKSKNKNSMNRLRIKRFKALNNYCKKNNLLHLFLGHHFDDNVETYITRKISGSSFEGLKSIQEITVIDKILIIRPLLSFKKKEIYKFIKKNSLFYIEDPTNRDENYTRVVVRNYLKTIDTKIIEKEFLAFIDYIPNYFNMNMETLIFVIVNINKRQIIIDNLKLKEIDDLIIERLIIYIYFFFFGKNSIPRSTKINILIDKLRNNDLKFFNLKSLLINKKSNLLLFSAKNT